MEPIEIGDQVIGIADDWEGVIGTIESRYSAGVINIQIDYLPPSWSMSLYRIGTNVRVFMSSFQRYMP